MEQGQSSSLFEMNFSQESRSHLAETASWARFLAICGIIFIGLLIVGGILISLAFTRTASRYGSYNNFGAETAGLGAGMIVMYILMGLLYFFPCLFTLQFANKMKDALASNDSLMLSESFRSLKKTFRYMGVLTIIGLAFFVLALVTGGLSALMF
jgi:uncharacterized membrane protein YjgN (DUF898 family)